MARFEITADPYQQNCDLVTSVSDNLKLVVTDPKQARKSVAPINKYTYEVIFGVGRKEARFHFIIGNTDLPMTKALWDKQLLLAVFDFYKNENDLEDLTLARNALTGNLIFQAEGVYLEERRDFE